MGDICHPKIASQHDNQDGYVGPTRVDSAEENLRESEGGVERVHADVLPRGPCSIEGTACEEPPEDDGHDEC